MAKSKTRSIETLIQQEDWETARSVIERELQHDPENHWLLAQLGVTFYEQRRYREALSPLFQAFELVPDCPLTLWNLAGVLDASGKPALATAIYIWLLRSKKSADDDSCWESAEWTDSLKTDCVYRLGISFKHMNRPESAEHCFRQYINLILAGMNGLYSVDQAAQQIRELPRNGSSRVDRSVRDAFKSTLQDSGITEFQGEHRKLSKLILPELLTN